MAVTVDYLGDTLCVKVNHSRIEGKNFLFEALVEDTTLENKVSTIEIDLNEVEYVNSLGIAEIISIHRYYESKNNGKTKIVFLNVDPKIAEIFRMVELDKICKIEEKQKNSGKKKPKS